MVIFSVNLSHVNLFIRPARKTQNGRRKIIFPPQQHLKSLGILKFLTNCHFCPSKSQLAYPSLHVVSSFFDLTAQIYIPPVFNIHVQLILYHIFQSPNTSGMEVVQRRTCRSLTYENRIGKRFVNSERFCKRINSRARTARLGIKQYSDKMSVCPQNRAHPLKLVPSITLPRVLKAVFISHHILHIQTNQYLLFTTFHFSVVVAIVEGQSIVICINSRATYRQLQ